MARRRRDPRTTTAKPAPKRDRMARVAVADDVWSDFRALAANDSISTVLGRLVEREVDRHRTRRLQTGALDDQELRDALDRAHQLAAIIERLERRLDNQPREFGP